MMSKSEEGDAQYTELIHPEAMGVLFDLDGTLIASNDQRVRYAQLKRQAVIDCT
jgi:predicted HAD superfamily phosphohydrolase YqeG